MLSTACLACRSWISVAGVALTRAERKATQAKPTRKFDNMIEEMRGLQSKLDFDFDMGSVFYTNPNAHRRATAWPSLTLRVFEAADLEGMNNRQSIIGAGEAVWTDDTHMSGCTRMASSCGLDRYLSGHWTVNEWPTLADTWNVKEVAVKSGERRPHRKSYLHTLNVIYTYILMHRGQIHGEIHWLKGPGLGWTCQWSTQVWWYGQREWKEITCLIHVVNTLKSILHKK